ncbi:MAG TPA: glycosyltransferase family A protein, partial [Solirubrobacteraceae bacterium]
MAGDGRGPRVSIVVPVYNAGGYLAQALATAVAQSYGDVEVVVVDDGSTDTRTLEILAAHAGRPGVHLHRTPNQGTPGARNLAIEHARGEYILPLDADDYLDPDFLAKTVPLLDDEPSIGVVHTWVGLVGGHRGVWRTTFSLNELLTRCTLHVTALYRRAVWADVGGYDRSFVDGAEDWDFWLSAAARGWQGRVVPEVLAYYRRTDASRERVARAPGVSGRLMRAIVAKHRALYEAHLEDVMAGMYEQR